MKLAKPFFIGFLGLIIFALLLPTFLPKTFHLQRQIDINATDTIIFNNIVNLKKFSQWSVWYQTEKEANIKFFGEDGWEKSQFNWSGREVGEGSLQIINAQKYTFIKMLYSFYKPWEFKSDMDFIIQKKDEHIYTVIWKNYGYLNYFLRYATMKYNGKNVFEERAGKDFEDGLSALKKMCETK